MMAAIYFDYISFDERAMFGILASVILLAITGLLLINDLDKPMRFIYVLLRPNWKSWLVKGGYTLGAFGAILSAHLAIYFLEISEITHIQLAIAGIPLAWLTGSYTGWLFKQAKGRLAWSQKSDLSIAITGTLEMAFFGGIAFGLMALTMGQTTVVLATSIIMAILAFWLGYKHILHGLREAQATPLL